MVVGVCGAGTMGAGIAQLAAQAGARTLVCDPEDGAAERGIDKARERLDDEAGARLEAAADLGALKDCDVIIEAAPERLGLKRELFGELEDIVAEDCVLATNTSSLLVTEIAATAERPERVVGMHFFNPAPVMKLVEVVAGNRSGEAALARARELGEAMGRRVVDATDGPGFLVNRCNRPFNLEALRCVTEGLATPEQVDRIVRLGGGFKMGPFELMDLVGLDTSFAVQRSFHEQSFGEPRWRPSPLVERMVAAGRLGRKSGEGFYSYPRERAQEPEAPAAAAGQVTVTGDGPVVAELEASAGPGGGGPQLVPCDVAPLAAQDPGPGSVGFVALAPFADCRLVELTRGPDTTDDAAAGAERFFNALGRHVEWVGDAPGLVLGRIAAQLVNEACFALGERIGSPEDIDAGMTLGLNHPRGPLEWGDAIGPARVLAMVRALHAELGDDRYRPAPALVRAARQRTRLRP